MSSYTTPIGRPNYMLMKSEQLVTLCEERGLEIPRTTKGAVVRGDTIASLIAWDREQGLRDIKYFKLLIHEQEGSNSSPYVYVSHNGRSYYIPRNREMVVPEEVITVLKDAVQIKVESIRKADGTFAYMDKPMQRYSFSILGEVAPSEFVPTALEETPGASFE